MLLLDRLPIHHPLLGLVCTALNRKSVMPRTADTSSNVRPSHSQNSMLDTPHARRKSIWGRPDRRGGLYPLRVGVTLSIHKLTAGSGYDYLTRQVAALDATEKGQPG
jgi:hypothetical protein